VLINVESDEKPLSRRSTIIKENNIPRPMNKGGKTNQANPNIGSI
jgi:hypothetical protein